MEDSLKEEVEHLREAKQNIILAITYISEAQAHLDQVAGREHHFFSLLGNSIKNNHVPIPFGNIARAHALGKF
jgi:hypothetical protein